MLDIFAIFEEFQRTSMSFLNILRGGHTWVRTNNSLRFEFPAGTLVYGEVVEEKRGEANSMRRVTGFHIINALYLGNEDVRSVDFKTRNEMIRMFCQVRQRITNRTQLHRMLG